MLAGENSSDLRVLVKWVPLSLEGGGGDAESRGARAGGHNSSRVRRGWQHLRLQPRRKMGTRRRLQKKTARRDCSRTATAAWAAVSGGDSPPSHAPCGPADSDLPLSSTTQAATGASQSIPGFLEQNTWGLVRRQAGEGARGALGCGGTQGHPPPPRSPGTCSLLSARSTPQPLGPQG